MVRLEPITEDNYWACLRLNVAEGQTDFVATNTISLAQAYVYPTLEPRAIFDDATMVGFVMYERPNKHREHYIHRLMVGAEYQRRGYGRAAMEAVIKEISTAPDYHGIKISFVLENTGVEALYAALGFERTGEIDDGEVVMHYRGH